MEARLINNYVVMPKHDYIAEHKKLTSLLGSTVDRLKEEEIEQSKEMKSVLSGGGSIDFKVAIPSYSRVKELGEKTLAMLSKYKYPKSKVYIFVSPDQHKEYKDAYPEYNVVSAPAKGILETRNFITRYFKDGEKLLHIDDDVLGIYKRIGDKKGKLVETNPIEFAKKAFDKIRELGLSVWGVNPVFNPFYMSDTVSTDLRYVVAAFRGYINRRDIILKGFDQKEDVENSILSYIRDGGILRYNNIAVKTTWYAPGGIVAREGGKEKRIARSKEAVDWLLKHYPEYGKIKQRPSGIYEFVLTKKPKVERKMSGGFKIPEDENTPVVIRLKPRQEYEAARDRFLEVVENYTIPPIEKTRYYPKGHPKEGQVSVYSRDRIIGSIGRTATFGFGDTRHGYKAFAANKKYPDLLRALIEVGNSVVPKGWSYSAIQLNVGVKAKKHIDGKNVGFSVIVGMGDYKDGGLYVYNPDGSDGKLLNIKNKPTMFNGAILPHETEAFTGDRYTVIYYNHVKGAKIPGYRTVGKGDDELIGDGHFIGGVFA